MQHLMEKISCEWVTAQIIHHLNFWWISFLLEKLNGSYKVLQPILSMPPILTMGWYSQLDQYKYKAATSPWTCICLKLLAETEDLLYICQQRTGRLKLPASHSAVVLLKGRWLIECAITLPLLLLSSRIDMGFRAVRLQPNHFIHCPGRWNVFFWISTLLNSREWDQVLWHIESQN